MFLVISVDDILHQISIAEEFLEDFAHFDDVFDLLFEFFCRDFDFAWSARNDNDSVFALLNSFLFSFGVVCG